MALRRRFHEALVLMKLGVWLLATSTAAAHPEPPDPAQPPPGRSQPVADVDSASSFDELEQATSEQGASPAPQRGSGAGARLDAELSAELDFAAAYFSDDDPLEGGAHDPDHTGFNLQQLELTLRSAVDPYFRFDTSLVFAPFGVEIEEAYATTLDLPAGLQARAGLFLTRFGRINATHLHAWDFVDQPFELGRLFGPEGNRGLGVEASVLLPLPWAVELVGSVTEAHGDATARSFYGANDLGVESLGDLQYTAALKQFFPLSRSWALAFGVSGAFGPNSTGRDNRTDIYGADAYLKYRPVDQPAPPIVALQAEWFYRRRQVPGELLHDFGAYAQLLYRFAERWAVAGRYESGSPAYGDSGSVAYDPLDPEWIELRRRYSASLSFFPSEFSRLRLQGNRDEPGYREGYWACFLALEVLVGAHGAHSF